MIESAPTEVPVICHVTVFVPAKSVPMLTVDVATEKCPFVDFNVADTPNRLVYLAVLTWFSIVTMTVLLSPTFKANGIWFEPSTSRMSRYWL